MRRIVVRNAAVIYDDCQTNRRWEADRVDASIERNLQGLAGEVSLALPFGSRQPELHASYRYSSDERAVDLSVQIGGVEPATLASLSPELAPLALADFPVSGTLTTRLDLGGLTNDGVRLALYLGKGSIKSEQLPEGMSLCSREPSAPSMRRRSARCGSPNSISISAAAPHLPSTELSTD
jgi:hypothetical protein